MSEYYCQAAIVIGQLFVVSRQRWNYEEDEEVA